jgi:hypothetical protein
LQFGRAIPEFLGPFIIYFWFLYHRRILIRLVVECLWLVDLHPSVVRFSRSYLNLLFSNAMHHSHVFEFLVSGLKSRQLWLHMLLAASLVLFIYYIL